MLVKLLGVLSILVKLLAVLAVFDAVFAVTDEPVAPELAPPPTPALALAAEPATDANVPTALL